MICPDCEAKLYPVHHSSDYHTCKLFLHPDKQSCPVTGSTKYLNRPPLTALFVGKEPEEDLPLNYLDGNSDAS